LARAQVRDLIQHLAQEPLQNYELLWVLESCLETPASTVYGLGSRPGSAGIMVLHRDCVWLRLDNELLLSSFLAPLPEQDYYRFYTTNPVTLDMLQRWFPQGQLSQSRLCARNLTKTWRRRFVVEVQVEPDRNAPGGEIYLVQDKEGGLAANCRVEEVVRPWHELVQWQLVPDQDIFYWTEQVLGAVTAALLAQGKPAVVRAEDENVFAILDALGYREFNQLFYYVAAQA
jgi:hypothetical protein